MTLQERIDEIKLLQKGQHWYITKQPLDFVELSYATKILKDYKTKGNGDNFETFFVNEAKKYSITQNHRMTNNCYYLGLAKQNGQYQDAIIADAFLEIERRCNSDFNNKDLYFDLLINQIEKVYTANEVDRLKDGIRSEFKIHPTFFLYKILVSIGDLTSNYSISLPEFKLFLGTAKNYNYYHSTISLIIETRKNNTLFTEINNLRDRFDDNRYNLLFDNLPYFEINRHTISLKNEYIETIRKKIYEYESKLNDNLFSIDFLTSVNKITSLDEIPKPINDDNYNIIFFGPPGTGKSYSADILTKGYPMEKVTFHPEYDYNSFVGGYKPVTDDDGNIKYQFIPQIFTNIYVKAWNNPNQTHFLQIEEINRGNVAAIFGDLFQLLDRDESGFSKYSVTAEEELKKYLEKNLNEQGKNGIKDGKIRLPKNLRIVATMNTSDQSLFPIDSAFKRRWKWKFVPIDYNLTASDFVIKLNNGKQYKWLEFIQAVNGKIYEITQSPDKQIGNFFVNATYSKNIINEETFINKVLFYLWNDIFKDENESIFLDMNSDKIYFEKLFEYKEEERSKIIEKIINDLGISEFTTEDNQD